MQTYIEVFGAQENNLKHISLKIPRGQLVVCTGVSGSGKSSLAFETIYAEAQRRYLETFPAYVKQFLTLKRPKVDQILGLSPAVSIEQKTVGRNPRSTVGTITEIYDFLRVLFARVATAYSKTGEKMVRHSKEALCDLVFSTYQEQQIQIFAPLIKGRKGQYTDLLNKLAEQGFLKVLIDGKIYDLDEEISLNRYKIHDISLLIDQVSVNSVEKNRLYEALHLALEWGEGNFILQRLELQGTAIEKSGRKTKLQKEKEAQNTRFFSIHLTCPSTGESYAEPDPNTFSFNSPYGACPNCSGIGEILSLDLKEIIQPKAIISGGIALLNDFSDAYFYMKLNGFLEKYGFSLTTKANLLPSELIEKIIYGSEEIYQYKDATYQLKSELGFEGILQILEKKAERAEETGRKVNINPIFQDRKLCPTCLGTRLKSEALYFKIGDKNIADLAQMSLQDLYLWVQNLPKILVNTEQKIATEVAKTLEHRLHFLLDVGLEYLHLNRSSGSLSGGEAQRIRLATQIGTQLSGVIYILDEPSIGLHPSDNLKLIHSLQKLRDLGNTVLVVEHDKEMMLAADFIVDIGPKAGKYGGQVVAALPTAEFCKTDTLTAQYVNGSLTFSVPERRKGNGNFLTLHEASGNNLKNVTVSFPLGQLIVVTGVSGSGKSSLIKRTLWPILHNHFQKNQEKSLPYQKIEGLEHLDKVVEIDQTPIGRTPRSNIATYVGFFTEIRTLFSLLPESKSRGYAPGIFSFNIKGGRCETCKGSGLKTIEMGFLPDVYTVCPDCQGKRYLPQTLEIRYKSKSISEILDLSVDEACVFFEAHPTILKKLKLLQQVGLGYLTLGQSSTTFSGGEAQRIKLATELSKKSTGKTMYLMDEPTTGLHFQDIQVLMQVVQKLVDLGNTVIIIEHNTEVMVAADHIIDFGPKGGIEGGQILATGTPEKVAESSVSLTAPFIKQELKVC